MWALVNSNNKTIERVVVTSHGHDRKNQYSYQDSIVGSIAKATCVEVEPLWKQLIIIGPEVESYREKKFAIPVLKKYLSKLPTLPAVGDDGDDECDSAGDVGHGGDDSDDDNDDDDDDNNTEDDGGDGDGNGGDDSEA